MGRGEAWIQAASDRHPVDKALFGTLGAVTAELFADISEELIGKEYDFMDVDKFEQIGSPSEMNRVYWTEMLFRVHWAASLNLMRHHRWQAGCVDAFSAPANFVSFAASLRGLMEASLDANYSLAPVLYTLADNRMMIESALRGSLQQFCVSTELEERLIHFVYARKVGKEHIAITSDSHQALEPKDYRNAKGLQEACRDGFRKLYDELCGICHPTAFSLSFLWDQATHGDAVAVRITGGNDDSSIRRLCQEHAETIELAMSISGTVSGLCLKALNWFSLPEVRSAAIERWNFDNVPAWKKAEDRLSKGIIH